MSGPLSLNCTPDDVQSTDSDQRCQEQRVEQWMPEWRKVLVPRADLICHMDGLVLMSCTLCVIPGGKQFSYSTFLQITADNGGYSIGSEIKVAQSMFCRYHPSKLGHLRYSRST